MGDFNWQYIIDAAAALYGLYVFLSAIKMKLTGEISSFVASPEELKNCQDKKEFAGWVFARMTGFGLVTFFYGILNILNSLFWYSMILNIGLLCIFLLTCAVFIFFLHRARKKYLNL